MDSAERREPMPRLRIQPAGPECAGTDEAEERDLIERARHGSHEAFAGLVARYQDRLYNMLYRMSHNHADAADWTQAAFLKAYEALERFDGRASFYTWLYRIATNLAISEFRTRRRRETHATDFTAGEPVGDGGDPAAGVERAELRVRMAQALTDLPEEYRVAVVLKDIEGLDYAGIAAILDIPVGTVRSRIHRGRTLLQQALQDEEPGA